MFYCKDSVLLLKLNFNVRDKNLKTPEHRSVRALPVLLLPTTTLPQKYRR